MKCDQLAFYVDSGINRLKFRHSCDKTGVEYFIHISSDLASCYCDLHKVNYKDAHYKPISKEEYALYKILDKTIANYLL